MKTVERYLNINGFFLFLIITVCYFIIIWLSKNVLINEEVFYNSFSEQLTYERSMKLFNELSQYSWINYLFSPLVLFLKFVAISLVLYTGVFFMGLHFKISFSKIFRIVIGCELVFVIAGIVKILWFLLLGGNFNLNDLKFFYPLSLINLFKISEVSSLWIYPLQSVNVFQVIYILMLSLGLNKVGDIEKTESEKIIIYSYMPALLFWIVLVMFMSIDSSV